MIILYCLLAILVGFVAGIGVPKLMKYSALLRKEREFMRRFADRKNGI